MWAPIRTPFVTACSQLRRMIAGSPAWNPQAMLALVTMSRSASSSPIRYAPKPSPRSLLRSIAGTDAGRSPSTAPRYRHAELGDGRGRRPAPRARRTGRLPHGGAAAARCTGVGEGPGPRRPVRRTGHRGRGADGGADGAPVVGGRPVPDRGHRLVPAPGPFGRRPGRRALLPARRRTGAAWSLGAWQRRSDAAPA